MSDIQLNISIKEENNILFKRCIRKLLDSTFIVGEKEEKLYMQNVYEKMSLTKLKEIAKEKNIKNYSKMNKMELVKALEGEE